MPDYNVNRVPPIAIRRQLRQEIGFGCPVPDCGNPYLYWHHFDPPWHIKQHHEPKGMIALCGEHHPKADAGAYTMEQLHEFKQKAMGRAFGIRGRFDWMRHEILTLIGGNLFYKSPVLVRKNGQPAIWLNRDKDGYILLNVRMITMSKEPRMEIQDNFWINQGQPVDLESPPSGKLLRVVYSNGDTIGIEFFEITNIREANTRFPNFDFERYTKFPEIYRINFPVTVAEIQETVGGTDIQLSSDKVSWGHSYMRNCLLFNSDIINIII